MSPIRSLSCSWSLNNEHQAGKVFLDLPAEILQLICDLTAPCRGTWALYNTSQQLRAHAARSLFRHSTINFKNGLPCMLNGRRLLPKTIFDLLLRWVSHIRGANIFGYSNTTPFNVFDLLSRMSNLRWIEAHEDNDVSQPFHRRYIRRYNKFLRLWPSCSFQSLEDLTLCIRSHWTIPYLPTLRNLSIDYEDRFGFPVYVDLTKLPQLSSFELEGYQGEDLTLLGHSETLRKVTIALSHIGSSFIQNLGRSIEELNVCFTEIYPAGRHPRIQLPILKVLSLQGSITFLPFLFPTNPSILEEVFVSVDWEDERSLRDLLQVLDLKRGDTLFTKHDGSLANFASRVTELVESLEWPVDSAHWESERDTFDSIDNADFEVSE